MIQRKQTLFLLASAILMALMPLLQIARVTTPEMLYSMTGLGFEDASGELVEPTWVLFVFGLLVLFISLFSIFLFKKRVVQMRLTMFNLFLKIGYVALAWLNLRRYGAVLEPVESEVTVTVWLALPLVAAIFDYLAHRGILADETTIRMMDRIR